MDQQKNNISLLFGVPGILLQIGAVIAPGLLIEAGMPPNLAGLALLGGLGLGTAMLMIGIAYYAMAKGHSAVWCLMAFLGIIGLIVLATLPDRHMHAQRRGKVTARISDAPTARTVSFNCIGCDYQLNGTRGNTCPECGRPFDPDNLQTVKVGGFEARPPAAPWQARWSLICGITGIVTLPVFFCGPILGITGVAFGHTARGAIKRNTLPGSGVALAGLITSYCAIGLSLAFITLIFIAGAMNGR